MAVWFQRLQPNDVACANKERHTSWIYGVALLIIYWLGKWAFAARPRRSRETGFRFVYVEEDGSARELSADERAYLDEEFEPTDGGRPYIKFNYNEKTPTGSIGGFLWRRHLPRKIPVKPAGEEPTASLQDT